MSQPPHDPDLTAVERALAGLAPSAGTLNRDALMFAAGRQSVRRGWAWPAVAAGSAFAAAVLAAFLLLRPPTVQTVVVEVPQPPREEPSRPADTAAPSEEPRPPMSPPSRETDYLTLRHQVERWGDAGLPASRPSAAEAPALDDDWLGLPPGSRVDPWLQRRKTQPNPGGPL
jgi:hypothetical protein